jgi:hypothetical protein
MPGVYIVGMATPTIGFRFTPRQRERLVRLARLLDTSQAQAVHEAVAHTLATLERREPLHRLVPSEQEKDS